MNILKVPFLCAPRTGAEFAYTFHPPNAGLKTRVTGFSTITTKRSDVSCDSAAVSKLLQALRLQFFLSARWSSRPRDGSKTRKPKANTKRTTVTRISHNFTIAAAFGNVHGVYKPGNVKLTPKILDNSQKYVQEKFGLGEKPVNFVFHGGSGSTVEEIREAIGYGAIKMNIDTDLQFAYTEGIRDYMVNNLEYLKTQIGNPDGDDKPNKKFYDPRVWIRKGEETFSARLEKAFEDLNNVNTL